MTDSSNGPDRQTLRFGIYTLLLSIVWTIVVAGLGFWAVAREQRALDRLMYEKGGERFDLDQAFRFWSVEHGGVYVPVTEKTPPNPHLSQIPERDIETPSGRALTLMDPAYMLRQFNEDYPVLYGISGHITSLKLLRPENKADAWETRALLAFEEGAGEVVEKVEIDGVPHLRLMRPMIVQTRCLKCHAHQGYKEGDIRGGVSVALSLVRVKEDFRTTVVFLTISFGTLWLLGLGGIVWSSGRLRRQFEKQATTADALAESEQRQELVLAGGALGIYDWRVQTGDVVFNDRWARMLGYKLEDIEPNANAWETLLHPNDKQRVKDILAAHLAGETPFYETVHRLRTKDGNWCWVLNRGKVFERDKQGRPLRMAGTHTDVTEMEEARRRLAASEHALETERSLFITGPTVVFRWRAAEGWPVDYVSPNVREVFGYDPEDLLSGALPFADIVHPEDLARVAEEVTHHVCEAHERFVQEYRLRHANGSWRYIRDWTLVERNEAVDPQFFLGYILDVTDEREAQEHKRQLEAQIQHSQKLESLGVLAGGIAHDFNNLLMVILGNTDLAKETVLPANPAKAHLVDIEKASRRAADLCRQMLAYSGKGRFIVEKVDIQSIVQEITQMLEVSISKKVVLRFDFATDLPPIEADSSQISQIVMNLVTNASEAIGDRSGGVSIRTGAMECDREYFETVMHEDGLEEGIYVYLEVADTGVGMSKEIVDRVFDPFFTTKFTGRGLGMAAVLGIVRGHKGAIKIYSEEGKGTTIKVLFPAVEGESDSQRRDSSAATDGWRGSGLVLVVDDEETVRALGRVMLESMGFDVITAHDGLHALEIYRDRRDEIVFVLLDLMMPHMNGEETFREIRRLNRNVKVLLTSGYNEQEVVERFAGKGLAGFIQKPFQRQELRDRITAFL